MRYTKQLVTEVLHALSGNERWEGIGQCLIPFWLNSNFITEFSLPKNVKEHQSWQGMTISQDLGSRKIRSQNHLWPHSMFEAHCGLHVSKKEHQWVGKRALWTIAYHASLRTRVGVFSSHTNAGWVWWIACNPGIVEASWEAQTGNCLHPSNLAS